MSHLGAFETLHTVWHRSDPIMLSNYRLKRVDGEDFERQIQAAIGKEDFSLANDLIHLAGSNGHALPKDLKNAANPDAASKILGRARSAIDGAITGEFKNSAGLVGAIMSDLSGIGDFRDLILQGKAAVKGQDYDAVVLALAATGVVLTGSVALSLGVSSPADTGVSILKNAYKSGQISKPLLRHIRRSSDGLIDIKKIGRGFSEIDNLKPSNAKAILKTSINHRKMDTLADLSRNVGRISSRSDIGTALQALKISENSAELSKVAKLSTHFGKRSRAVLSVLGRGALVATGLLLSFAGWIVAVILWLASTIWITFKLIKLSLAPFRSRA